MKTGTLVTCGRYLFGALVLFIGLFHFWDAGGVMTIVPAFVPGGVFWFFATGIALIVVSIIIMLDVQVKRACRLLAVGLVIIVLTVHLPAAIENMTISSGLLKDTALASAFLLLATTPENKR